MLYPARYTLPPLILGYDWDFSFTYEVSGAGLDFTDYSMSLKVMDSYDSAVLDTWSSGDGDITLGDDGTVAIVIASDDQSNLSVGKKKYIIELTDPDGDISLIMTGDWPVVDINGA
jgi:hypothetical protein